MPSRNTIEIAIQGEDKASKVIDGVEKRLQQFDNFVKTVVVAGGIKLAVDAISNFTERSLTEFGTFQKGMAEVFTLLPGISQDAMDKLEEQVQYISVSYGKLSSEVIPAVYQSLSAGVPPDDIFGFISTASKASIAGLTSLETSVNGISSVLNAYGLEASEASRISDIMFTGVRLGKTTFGELSASIFQLLPSLTDLGISFEQGVAAIDSLTSLGTPTSVAVTQIRAMLVELQKPTTEVSKLFQEMAGKSFPDFIKNGGSVSDALNLIRKGAEQSDRELGTVFGSVEALNGFLSLTGPNAERFAGFVDQMGASAGATEQAFKTMSKTMLFQVDRLNAKISGFFINIGRKLEPIASKAIEQVGDIISVFDDFFNGDMNEGGDFTGFAKVLFDALKPIKPIIDEIQRLFNGFFGAIEAGIPFVDALRVYINAILPTELLQPFDDFLHLINDIGNAIGQALAPIIEWIKNNIELKDVLIVIAGAIATVVLPAILGIVSALVSFAAPIAALIAGVSLLRQAWENDFGGIRTFVTEKLLPALEDIVTWFLQTGLPGIIQKIQEFADNIKTFVEDHLEFVLAIGGIAIALGVLFLAASIIPAAIGAITLAIGILLSPVVILTAAIAALIYAASELYPGGLSKLLSDAATSARQLGFIIFSVLNTAVVAANRLVTIFSGTITKVKEEVDKFIESLGVLKGLLGQLNVTRDTPFGQNPLTDLLKGSLGILGGAANGIEYVDRDKIIKVHRGESVLTADETESRMNGVGGNTNNVTINLSGNYRNQNEANRDVDMLTNALKLKGIQLSRA